MRNLVSRHNLLNTERSTRLQRSTDESLAVQSNVITNSRSYFSHKIDSMGQDTDLSYFLMSSNNIKSLRINKDIHRVVNCYFLRHRSKHDYSEEGMKNLDIYESVFLNPQKFEIFLRDAFPIENMFFSLTDISAHNINLLEASSAMDEIFFHFLNFLSDDLLCQTPYDEFGKFLFARDTSMSVQISNALKRSEYLDEKKNHLMHLDTYTNEEIFNSFCHFLNQASKNTAHPIFKFLKLTSDGSTINLKIYQNMLFKFKDNPKLIDVISHLIKVKNTIPILGRNCGLFIFKQEFSYIDASDVLTINNLVQSTQTHYRLNDIHSSPVSLETIPLIDDSRHTQCCVIS